MTRAEIDDLIDYWENQKQRYQNLIYDAEYEISELLAEVPDDDL